MELSSLKLKKLIFQESFQKSKFSFCSMVFIADLGLAKNTIEKKDTAFTLIHLLL